MSETGPGLPPSAEAPHGASNSTPESMPTAPSAPETAPVPSTGPSVTTSPVLQEVGQQPSVNMTPDTSAATSTAASEAPRKDGGWIASFGRVLKSVIKQAGEPQGLNPMSKEPPKPLEMPQAPQQKP